MQKLRTYSNTGSGSKIDEKCYLIDLTTCDIRGVIQFYSGLINAMSEIICYINDPRHIRNIRRNHFHAWGLVDK